MSEPRRQFWIGVDIGQKVDHSAVCLVETVDGKAIVRLLIKYDLGITWDLLINSIKMFADDIGAQGDIVAFTVDATGVGAVPAEMIQSKLPNIRVDNFIFTNKSKRELVGKVKVMHSFGKLKFAYKGKDEGYKRTIQQLLGEMRNLQIKVIRSDDIANPEIEVFKTGAHDDLFTALALAVKDVDVNIDYANAGQLMGFVEDKTWTKTPLDDNSVGIVLY